MFTIPRELLEKFPSRLHLEQTSRGVYTGQFEQALTKTARHIGAPVSGTEGFRNARLALARTIFEKESLVSFNELSDAELWALQQWVTHHKKNAFQAMKIWLAETYGQTKPMFTEDDGDTMD